MINILAIDDINDNLIAINALISEAFPDAKVFTALNGADGIRLAVDIDPDVILLDILMPEMDGFEVCCRMKKNEVLRDIPIVFVTALKESKENRIKALEVGAEGFLSKPIDETELTAQIRAMVKIKAANNQKLSEKYRLNQLVAERTRHLEESNIALKFLLDDIKLENETRKRFEENLKGCEQQYRELFEIAPIGIYRIAPKGEIIMANPHLLNLLEYDSFEEFASQYNDKESQCCTTNKVRDEYKKIMSTKGNVNQLKTSWTSKSGKTINVLESARILADENGNTLFYIGIIEKV